MLDGTEYFECDCGSDEHTIRFTLDLDEDCPTIYTSQYLTPMPFRKRLWMGLKYIFGYRSRFGEFGNYLMRPDDAERLKNMLDRLVHNA